MIGRCIALAAPPWLQRDWDFWAIACVNWISCSTSLTSKGLRRNKNHYFISEIFLQHLPDFKGIETCHPLRRVQCSSCSTSLTSKGLRRYHCTIVQIERLAAPPWLQRDWDQSMIIKPWCEFLQHLPDFKGIETKGRPWTAALIFLQHLPDFKGIETCSACL